MPWALEELNRDRGLNIATHAFNTTVGSFALISAPSSGKTVYLRAIELMSSGTASARLTTGTAAATTYFQAPGSAVGVAYLNYVPCRIPCDDGTAVTMHTTAGIGNGYIRVYYTIELSSGNFGA